MTHPDDSTFTPDWNLVPFAIPCPECNQDIHGVTEPCCPHCGYTTTWKELIPIDTLRCPFCDYRLYGTTKSRCPECGNRIERHAIIERARERFGGFEREFSTRFFSSLIKTIYFSVLKPKDLWKGFALGVSPNLPALLILIFIQACFQFLSWPILGAGISRGMDAWAKAWGLQMGFVYKWGFLSFYFPALIAWYCGTLIALYACIQTHPKRKITWPHVLRAYVYSFFPVALLPVPWLCTELVEDIFIYFIGVGQPPFAIYERTKELYLLLMLFLFWRSLSLACKYYFKIPYPRLTTGWCLLMGWCAYTIIYEFVL